MTDDVMPDSRPFGHKLPLMLQLHYSDDIGMLTIRPLRHNRPCVTFTPAAAEYCGGAVDLDDDGYVVRCAGEVDFVETARELLEVLHTGWRESKDRKRTETPASPRDVKPRAMHSSGLQCAWISWRRIADGHLALDMPAGNCCDMTGAIKAAVALCPEVRRIDTCMGGAPDTTYVLHQGRWEARDGGSRPAKPLRLVPSGPATALDRQPG